MPLAIIKRIVIARAHKHHAGEAFQPEAIHWRYCIEQNRTEQNNANRKPDGTDLQFCINEQSITVDFNSGLAFT